MAAISLSFTTTANQDTKLANLLARINAQRAAQNPPLTPFADVTAYLRDVIIQTVVGQLRALAQVEQTEVAAAYDAAGAAAQAAVKAALGLP